MTTMAFVASEDERARAHALLDTLLGPSDPRADRSVEVLHAHAAALAWIREAVGSYPTPPAIAVELDKVVTDLRGPGDERDPVVALAETALRALAAYRAAG